MIRLRWRRRSLAIAGAVCPAAAAMVAVSVPAEAAAGPILVYGDTASTRRRCRSALGPWRIRHRSRWSPSTGAARQRPRVPADSPRRNTDLREVRPSSGVTRSVWDELFRLICPSTREFDR